MSSRALTKFVKIPNYFAFVAIEDGTFTLSRYAWEYSLDGRTWTTLEVNTPSPLINAGNTIYWRATLGGGAYGAGRVTSTAKYKVKGNIMSLYYGDNFEGVDYMTNKGSIGREMFSNEQNLISASELELPALALNGACYYQMFYNCKNLTDTPALPATTLNNQCYTRMFMYCSSLLHPPVLPATTLQTSCYSGMFSECTSLMEAPSLPATTMVNSCYHQMFYKCNGLTTAPVLPATTLVSNCYKEMFYGCTSLNYIKAMFTTEPSTSYTQGWVSQVASSGTFVKNSAATWNVTGSYGVPNNWTVQTASE